MRSYDVQRIKEDTDCREVAAELGLLAPGANVHMKDMLIVCPWHDERKHDNCKVNRGFAHCFSCGNSGDVIGIVQRYRENTGGDTTFPSIVSYLAERLGADKYLLEDDGQEPESVKKDRVPFTENELQCIGLTLQQSSAAGKAGISLAGLYENNRQLFWQLVKDRCIATVNEMSEINENLRSGGTGEAYSEETRRRIDVAHRIFEHFDTDEKLPGAVYFIL